MKFHFSFSDNSSVRILHAAAQAAKDRPEASSDGIHYGGLVSSVVSSVHTKWFVWPRDTIQSLSSKF